MVAWTRAAEVPIAVPLVCWNQQLSSWKTLHFNASKETDDCFCWESRGHFVFVEWKPFCDGLESVIGVDVGAHGNSVRGEEFCIRWEAPEVCSVSSSACSSLNL